ncbi:hypothetical protein IFM89_030084 [Coptis chinensis]|uniref:Uncharacterized protein n=1 Tax=Coptis chinensis TaxID=261450 RepID=A0A835MFU5_9MAGN|nr:hypothetical protein IFM89_030084 [Coptis chinensis]
MEGNESLGRFSPEFVVQDLRFTSAVSLLPPIVLFHGTTDYSIPSDSKYIPPLEGLLIALFKALEAMAEQVKLDHMASHITNSLSTEQDKNATKTRGEHVLLLARLISQWSSMRTSDRAAKPLDFIGRCFSGDKNRLGGDFNTAVVNDNEEAEEHRLSCTPSAVSGNFRGKGIISDQLRQPVQPEGEPHVSNPRPLKLLKETVSQEEPHIRDSLPTTRVKNRFFHPSFPGNTSAEVENEVTVKRYANENGYPLKINQVKEETEDAVSFELSAEESETPSTIEPIVEESLNLAKVESPRNGPSYYPEQSGRKEILKGGKGTSGSKRLKPSGARTSLYNNISFDRFSEAMLVLRQPLELRLEEIVELTGGFHPDCCISKHEQFKLYDEFLRDPSFHAMVKMNGDPTGVIEAEKRVTCSLFHRNIMELSAYHDSANVTALVYAIADKGTLDQYLYGIWEDALMQLFIDFGGWAFLKKLK